MKSRLYVNLVFLLYAPLFYLYNTLLFEMITSFHSNDSVLMESNQKVNVDL